MTKRSGELAVPADRPLITLSSVRGYSQTNVYNGLDTRVSKTVGSLTSTYHRAGAMPTDPVLSDGANFYTPGISVNDGTSSRFQHGGLKSFEAQSDSRGTIQAERQYDAFGNLLSASGTRVGELGYGGAFGYQEDEGSGLRLLGHRYYDSSTGRFLTRDPIKDGRNWYVYCENDPIHSADADGLRRIIIVRGDQGYAPDGDDISGYTNGIIEDIRRENPKAELIITDSADEAYAAAGSNAKSDDELVFIGHSDETGLHTSSGPLDPFQMSKARKGKRFGKIVLIGCHSLSNAEQAAAWGRLSNGNLWGTYYFIAINWYDWGIKIPGFSNVVRYNPGRVRVGGGMKQLWPPKKKQELWPPRKKR